MVSTQYFFDKDGIQPLIIDIQTVISFLVPITRIKPLEGTNVSTFYNVIVQDGADPWVYQHTDGWYYMTFTTGGDVRIWRSRSLTSIVAGDSILAWKPSGLEPACRDVWAPELHFIHSSW